MTQCCEAARSSRDRCQLRPTAHAVGIDEERGLASEYHADKPSDDYNYDDSKNRDDSKHLDRNRQRCDVGGRDRQDPIPIRIRDPSRLP